MIRVDPKLATALIPLSTDDNFVLMKNWLNTSFIDQLTRNIDLRGEEGTRGQGYAEALRDILNILEEPRKLAEKFKRHP